FPNLYRLGELTVARSVACALGAALARGRANQLGFQHLLQRFAQQLLEQVPIRDKQAFAPRGSRFTLVRCGHGSRPLRAGWLRQPTSCHDCLLPSSSSATNSGHYPWTIPSRSYISGIGVNFAESSLIWIQTWLCSPARTVAEKPPS